jgi:hypothetical protein
LANPAVLQCVSNLQKALLTSVKPSRADVSQGMRQAIDLARQQSDAPAMLSAMRELAQLHGFSPIEPNEVVADSQEAPAWKFRWMDDAELVAVMKINGANGDDSR